MRQLTQGIHTPLVFFFTSDFDKTCRIVVGQIGLYNGGLTYLLFRLRLRMLAYIANHIMQNIVLIDLVTQML